MASRSKVSKESDAAGEVREAPSDAVPHSQVDEILGELAGLPDAPDLCLVEPLVRQLAVHAAALDALAREVVRGRAISVLGEKKVQAPARLLDLAFKGLGPAVGDQEQAQGRRLQFSDPEPWPEPVDGADLLQSLADLFLRYVVLPAGGSVALALWTVFTYVHDAEFISPLLALPSPEKRCGKTTVLHLLTSTVRRPLPTSNITPAALFRSIEKYQPTLLVDEADTFLAEREELQGVLNSGHTRKTAYVIRTVGEQHEPKLFSTWAPKVIALIGRLPSTLEDRAVQVPMRRKAPGETVERLRLDSLEKAEEIRRKALRWAADTVETLGDADPEVPSELHDRAADNWRPLLAIADAAGGPWPELAREAVIALAFGDSTDDSSPGIALLRDIREVFQRSDEDRLLSKCLTKELRADEGRPWGEWQNGKPLSPITMARMLRPFGVKPRKIRVGTVTRQGYLEADFEDAFNRYLPSDPEHPEQPNDDGHLRDSSTRNTRANVPGRKSAETPITTGLVPGVPGRKGRTLPIKASSEADREVFEL